MSQLSAKSFNNEIFDNVFEENAIGLDNLTENTINLSDLADLVDMTDADMLDNKSSDRVSLKSNSTCSSRSSYTNESSNDGAIEDEDMGLSGEGERDDNSESGEHE
jgi:hypothetical protein